MAQIIQSLVLILLGSGLAVYFFRSRAGTVLQDNDKVKDKIAEDEKKIDMNNILLSSEEEKRKEIEDKIKDTKNVSNDDLEKFFKDYKKNDNS